MELYTICALSSPLLIIPGNMKLHVGNNCSFGEVDSYTLLEKMHSGNVSVESS